MGDKVVLVFLGNVKKLRLFFVCFCLKLKGEGVWKIVVDWEKGFVF